MDALLHDLRYGARSLVRMRGAAFAVDEPTGDGHVIMIAGSPAFRLFWRSTERLLLNAVIYGPTLD